MVQVISIEPLGSLTPAQLQLVGRLRDWPDDEPKHDLRAYRLEGGEVGIAPWDPAIEPGTDVYMTGRLGLVAVDTFGEAEGPSVR